MNHKLSRGASIIVERWLQIREGESLFIVTNDNHLEEMKAVKHCAEEKGATVALMSFPKEMKWVSRYFDENESCFDNYQVILGATTHSLVTTKAVKRAIERGMRFLSLPLAMNSERSMLELEFLNMNPEKSKAMAYQLLARLADAEVVHVTTEKGTDMEFQKKNRRAQYFTGATKDGNGYSSSSFEVFIPVEEDSTYGTAIVDASFGYLGIMDETVKLEFNHGKIVEIESNTAGRKLKEFIDQYEDERMLIACELGIGLNEYAKCNGECYIEDESAYGTFHIGFGRNIAFGGKQEANGHFDLVFDKPDIYADGVLIMEQGEIIWERIRTA
nr:aminopeptidase [uncultured Lachnoclostridium sp.]